MHICNTLFSGIGNRDGGSYTVALPSSAFERALFAFAYRVSNWGAFIRNVFYKARNSYCALKHGINWINCLFYCQWYGYVHIFLAIIEIENSRMRNAKWEFPNCEWCVSRWLRFFLVYIFGRNGKSGNDAHGIKRQTKQRIVSGMMAFCAFSQFFLYTVLNTRHLNNGTTLANANKLFCLHEQSDIYLS